MIDCICERINSILYALVIEKSFFDVETLVGFNIFSTTIISISRASSSFALQFPLLALPILLFTLSSPLHSSFYLFFLLATIHYFLYAYNWDFSTNGTLADTQRMRWNEWKQTETKAKQKPNSKYHLRQQNFAIFHLHFQPQSGRILFEVTDNVSLLFRLYSPCLMLWSNLISWIIFWLRIVLFQTTWLPLCIFTQTTWFQPLICFVLTMRHHLSSSYQ